MKPTLNWLLVGTGDIVGKRVAVFTNDQQVCVDTVGVVVEFIGKRSDRASLKSPGPPDTDHSLPDDIHRFRVNSEEVSRPSDKVLFRPDELLQMVIHRYEATVTPDVRFRFINNAFIPVFIGHVLPRTLRDADRKPQMPRVIDSAARPIRDMLIRQKPHSTRFPVFYGDPGGPYEGVLAVLDPVLVERQLDPAHQPNSA